MARVCGLTISKGVTRNEEGSECLGPIEEVFGYNKDTNRCEVFSFTGCGGNGNRFLDVQECVAVCGGGEPMETADCREVECDTREHQLPLARGCTPITRRGECCPSSWDCQTWEVRKAISSMCFFSSEEDPEGKLYNLGGSIPAVSQINGCYQDCHCRMGDGIAEISCASVDCPYFFNPEARREDCRATYESTTQCCESDTTCGEELTALPTCDLDGNTFYQGELMYPESDPCLVCHCQPGFHSSDLSQCRRIDCGLQLSGDNLLKGCTPVYQDSVCCPTDWICPNSGSPNITADGERQTAVRKSDACLLPKDIGRCRSFVPRFYFDSSTGQCETFSWGGCRGNDNRFESLEECQSVCKEHLKKHHLLVHTTEVPATQGKEARCNDPVVTGRCRSRIQKYFYNPQTSKCQQFFYSGCRGGPNMFSELVECEAACLDQSSTSPRAVTLTRSESPPNVICSLAKEVGPCRAAMPRWFYNSQIGDCQAFYYGGCRGNENNFPSESSCREVCSPGSLTTTEPSRPRSVGVSATPSTQATCSLPMEAGPCRSLRPRVFYNSETHQCEPFIYSGCRGNRNNFPSVEVCQAECGAESNQGAAVEQRCVLGNETYTLGDVVRLPGGDKCRSCTCSSPPGLTCFDKVCPLLAFTPPRGGVNCVIVKDPMGCCDIGIRCDSVIPPQPPSLGGLGGGLMGGFRQEQLSGETKMIAALATNNLLKDVNWIKNECDHLVLLEVLEVHRQIVAGTNFRLKLKLRTKSGPECSQTEEKECENITVFRPLPHTCDQTHQCLQLSQIQRIECTLGY